MPADHNIQWSAPALSRDERWRLLGCHGRTLWFTGLSGSGKSTVAAALEAELLRRGIMTYRLDGDNIRHGLNAGLGFSAADRAENIRRIAEVARLFADAGVVALVSFISPYRADRDAARRLHEAPTNPASGALPFFEVFVDAPIEVCERRDPKGLYKKARAGQITGFTGIDDPYEPPEKPDLVLQTERTDLGACVRACLQLVEGAARAGGSGGASVRL
jgi:adenylyl-sulfate kinase